ncbi:MAG: methyltransferase domain-containing protein [Pseudomonadota bacterium]
MTVTSPTETAPAAPSIENYHGLVRSDIFPYIPRTEGWLVDIGGGTGATALAAKAQGLADKVAVLDQIDESHTTPGLDYYRKTDISSREALAGCAEDLGGFDTVLALDVLEHLVDPWQTVADIHSCMKPGGVFIASIPNVREINASLPLLFGNKWEYKDAGILDRTHLRFFVKSTAVELMVSSGLKLKEVIPAPFTARRFKLLRAATLGLFNSFLDRAYIIVVEKADG